MKKTNSGGIVAGAAANAFLKLDPRVMMHNPVMFVTEVGSAVTTVYWILALIQGTGAGFIGAIALCLWFTVLFANFAEAMAEGRGKAQADTLRQMKTDTPANLVGEDGSVRSVPAGQLKKGDIVKVSAGEIIPGDGDVIWGIASVDESARATILPEYSFPEAK